jgi:serine/threonine protein kinase/Tol biopolymer transport system component
MAIAIGQHLGSYEITALLGKGGMGEVYRARDTKLKRDVAIKCLPEEFARDSDRVSRFQREAEVLASLNHPNIAAIYDLEGAGDSRFLVLELVEGDTLAECIQRGPIPVEEALQIAHGICEALEAAHEKGIVHRDLKPANVKITPDGKVKVLDFGLAKALEAPLQVASNSPTLLTAAATNAGIILGTAGYMSPEQARGHGADQRSDNFSFGCVLFEMLTGRQTFQGETVTDIIASVVKSDPDFRALPAKLHPKAEELIRRCLAKNRKDRYHAIADVRVELETIMADPLGLLVKGERVYAPRPLWKRAIPVLVAAILAGTVVGIAVWNARPSIAPPTITRFLFTLPEGQQFLDDNPLVPAPFLQLLAISPDGTQMVYVANRRLYLRSFSELAARPIAGTEVTQGALGYPVFSPDSRSIAFWSGDVQAGAVKRIGLTGGVAVTICQANYPFGMSWSNEGIVFGQGDGIKRVSANGGQPELLLSVKGSRLSDPQVLPGGEAVLYSTVGVSTVRAALGGTTPNTLDKAQIVVQSLRSGERKPLIEGSSGRYLPTGHLTYARGGTLWAVPFDLKRREVTGGPVPVVEGVKRALGALAYFSVSDTGSLIYIPGPLSTSLGQSTLVLVDRNGGVEPLKLRPAAYQFPRISPDGKRVALGIDDGNDANIWIYELSGANSMRQLTFGSKNRFPIWSADSERIAFQSDREGDFGIFWQRVDGTGTAERLTKPDAGTEHAPESWSPDGSRFLFSVSKGSNLSLWTFSLPDKKAAAFGDVQATFLIAATFSPNGRWVAYSPGSSPSDRSVFVQPFPATGAKYRILGGIYPLWSPDGRELFFRSPQAPIQVVRVTLRPSFEFGNPETVPAGAELPFTPLPFPERQYDITPDGKRFIGVVPAGESQGGTAGARQIQVVLNWFRELQERVPVK